MADVDPGAYEQAAARKVRRTHTVAFAYARHALAAGLKALGAEPGDEVILSPLTCRIVPLTLLALRLRPVYADIKRETLNLDADRLTGHMGPRTKAILFQHTYGSDAGIREVAELAARRSCLLLEDCAQSMPTADDGYSPGRLGRAAVFSCNLLKPLPAGSGGFLATNDDTLAERVREARNGLPDRPRWNAAALIVQDWLQRRIVGPRTYWPVLSAYRFVSHDRRTRPVEVEIRSEFDNPAWRPTALQLRQGLRWMQRADAVAEHRRRCCADYEAALVGRPRSGRPIGGDLPLLYFPVLAGRKPALLAAARQRRLQIVAWPGSTPIYPVERMRELPKYGYEPGTCPIAESVAGQLVGLPTETDVTADLRRRIVDLVTSCR